MSAFLKKERFVNLIAALEADGHTAMAERVRKELDEQAGGSWACIYLPLAVIATYSEIITA